MTRLCLNGMAVATTRLTRRGCCSTEGTSARNWLPSPVGDAARTGSTLWRDGDRHRQVFHRNALPRKPLHGTSAPPCPMPHAQCPVPNAQCPISD
ncbi:MAG: hypothetical protein ICV78_09875 [Tolypothrix sp. Co-bin9]|nr:hypothetical protein [Tolypothrix sp. Co-bin9]